MRQLGQEVREEDLPLDRSDLSSESQLVFSIYDMLPTRWEGFSGLYLGKDLSMLSMLFKEFELDKAQKKYCLFLIPIIDSVVGEEVSKKQKAEAKKAESKGAGIRHGR